MGFLGGLICLFRDHNWKFCTCPRCDAKRDENHLWDGCMCMLCGEKRDGHHWYDKCFCCICYTAKPIEADGHVWTQMDGCKCEVCGQGKHIFEKKEACSICNGSGLAIPPLDINGVSFTEYDICYGCSGFAATVVCKNCEGVWRLYRRKVDEDPILVT